MTRKAIIREASLTEAEHKLSANSLVLKAKPKSSLGELVLELILVIIALWLIFRPGQGILSEDPNRRFVIRQEIGGKVFNTIECSNLSPVVYASFWTNWDGNIYQSNHLTNWRTYRWLRAHGFTKGGYLID